MTGPGRRRRAELVALVALATLVALAAGAGIGDRALAEKRQPPAKTGASQKKQKAAAKPLARPATPAAAPDTAGASAEEIAARRKELLELRQQIDRERAEAERLRGKEKQVLAEINAADRQLSSTRSYLKKLADQERAINRRLGALELDLRARENDLDRATARLAHRVREMYKSGQPSLVEIVFSSESLPDLADRIYMLGRIAEEERKLMGSITTTRERLAANKAEAERSVAEVQQIEAEKKKEQSRAVEIKKDRETQVSSLRKQRTAHETTARELKAAQDRLESLIRRLETQRRTEPEFVPPSGPFSLARGKLPWPVRGKVIEGFGLHTHPKFGTSTRNNGIDIQAPAGAQVRAVADGIVDYCDWLTGYGNCVILNHGQSYYTLYAHLAAVAVKTGQTVSGGDVIGSVGDTGSLKGPMLHFEVRHGANAADPESWLR
jgi:septal ring factor EnvC (AmiA/AmiB activator)